MLKNASLLLMFLLAAVNSFAQLQEPRMGLSIKPIIPSGLFDNLSLDKTQNGIEFSIKPQPGYSAGVVIRQDLPYLLSLETGIYYVRRIYGLSITDSGNTINNKFRFVNYEIPVTGLIYIRLSEQIYLNTAFGLSFDFFPNNVFIQNKLHGQLIERNYWVLPALAADVGTEYRTKKSGNFYIGGSYHRMLLPMARLAHFENGNPKGTVISPISGHYFAFNFKYFFPTQRTAPVDFF